MRSHTLAPTTICDLSHSACRSRLTDLGHISSVTYVCHPLWFVCDHRKGILTSPLISREWLCPLVQHSKEECKAHLTTLKPIEKVNYLEFICCMTKVLKVLTDTGIDPDQYIVHMGFIAIKAAAKGRCQNTQQRITKGNKGLLVSLQNSVILLVCKSRQRFNKSCLYLTKRH